MLVARPIPQAAQSIPSCSVLLGTAGGNFAMQTGGVLFATGRHGDYATMRDATSMRRAADDAAYCNRRLPLWLWAIRVRMWGDYGAAG